MLPCLLQNFVKLCIQEGLAIAELIPEIKNRRLMDTWRQGLVLQKMCKRQSVDIDVVESNKLMTDRAADLAN